MCRMYNNYFIFKKFYRPKIPKNINIFFHVNLSLFQYKIYKHIIYYLHYSNRLFLKKIKIYNNTLLIIH